MIDYLVSTPLFGLFFSALCWWFGRMVQDKVGHPLCNSLIITIVTGIALLSLFGIPYADYYATSSILTNLLAPVTAILALNIYRQRIILKKYFLPVLVGCLVGSLTSLFVIVGLCHLFSVDSVLTASILPKSVTTAIAMSIAESRGGVGGIAAAAVMMAGLTGYIFAPYFAKWFRITDPVAEGLAIGACSHAMGTSKAVEIGEIQGAMSSIALCLCGIITSILVLFF